MNRPRRGAAQQRPPPPLELGSSVVSFDGFSVRQTAPHELRDLPATPEGYDGLLILGGAMDAWNDETYPHLGKTVTLIRAFADAGKPVLGICLGCQLVARAYGGRVYRLPAEEVGFVPLTATEAGKADRLLHGLDPAPHLFQWHQDTYDLPEDAELLMTGEAVANQVFRLGERVYAFQCHVEVTADIVREWFRTNIKSVLEKHPGFLNDFDRQTKAHMHDSRLFAEALTGRWLDLVAESMEERGVDAIRHRA